MKSRVAFSKRATAGASKRSTSPFYVEKVNAVNCCPIVRGVRCRKLSGELTAGGIRRPGCQRLRGRNSVSVLKDADTILLAFQLVMTLAISPPISDDCMTLI